MRLFLIGVVAIAFALVVQYWQRMQVRRAKRELLRLRDDLRFKAIAERQFRNGKTFQILDGLLGALLEDIEAISLWEIVPFMGASKNRSHAAFDQLVQESKYASALFSSVGAIIVRLLWTRHLAVVVVLAFSIVGVIPLLVLEKPIRAAAEWFSMSEATKSAKPRFRLVRSG